MSRKDLHHTYPLLITTNVIIAISCVFRHVLRVCIAAVEPPSIINITFFDQGKYNQNVGRTNGLKLKPLTILRVGPVYHRWNSFSATVGIITHYFVYLGMVMNKRGNSTFIHGDINRGDGRTWLGKLCLFQTDGLRHDKVLTIYVIILMCCTYHRVLGFISILCRYNSLPIYVLFQRGGMH